MRLYFVKFSSIYDFVNLRSKMRERKREKKKELPPVGSCPNSQEPGTPESSPMWMTGTQLHELESATFQDVLLRKLDLGTDPASTSAQLLWHGVLRLICAKSLLLSLLLLTLIFDLLLKQLLFSFHFGVECCS